METLALRAWALSLTNCVCPRSWDPAQGGLTLSGGQPSWLGEACSPRSWAVRVCLCFKELKPYCQWKEQKASALPLVWSHRELVLLRAVPKLLYFSEASCVSPRVVPIILSSARSCPSLVFRSRLRCVQASHPPSSQLAGHLAPCPSLVLPLKPPVESWGWFFSSVLQQLCWRLQLHPPDEGNSLQAAGV